MVELEDSIVPKLDSHLQFWKRYVDDTLTVVKEGSINKKSTLCGKRVAFKHRKVQTQAFISTGSHLRDEGR